MPNSIEFKLFQIQKTLLKTEFDAFAYTISFNGEIGIRIYTLYVRTIDSFKEVNELIQNYTNDKWKSQD